MPEKKKKFDIDTWLAFVIWAILITTAFYLRPDSSNFNTFCMWLTVGVATYTGKRLFQKRPEFNNVK